MAALQRKRLFAAAVFLGSALVLAIQLVNSSPVVVSVGENGTNVAELGGYFGYRAVGIITGAAVSLGASGTYLLVAEEATESTPEHEPTTPPEPQTERSVPLVADRRSESGTDQRSVSVVQEPGHPTEGTETEPSDELLEARKREWEETADRLANKEREVYEAVLVADGVLAQSDIVDGTDLSKASVSRALDGLEAKNLVERKRRGIGNMVLLC